MQKILSLLMPVVGSVVWMLPPGERAEVLVSDTEKRDIGWLPEVQSVEPVEAAIEPVPDPDVNSGFSDVAPVVSPYSPSDESIEIEEVRFTPPADDSVDADDERADELGEAFGRVAGMVDDIHRDQEELARSNDMTLETILQIVTEIQRKQVTVDDVASKSDVREVVKEELEAFERRVEVKWKNGGNVVSSSIPVDENGKGKVSLPKGAVITEMGGVPLSQWKASNPSAVVVDGSVSSGVVSNGSSGGSSGMMSVSRPVQYSAPVATTAYESSVVPFPVQGYEIPGQVSATVMPSRSNTEVMVELTPTYNSQSSCYTDPFTGQTVCPAKSSSQIQQPVRGPIARLFGR